MSMAQRQQRSRWLRAVIGRMTRDKAKRDVYWFMKSPADVVAYTLAFAHFDASTNAANYSRWKEINAYVLHYLKELEHDFAQ